MDKKEVYLGTGLLLALIVGALSGIIASVFTNQSIDRYVQSLSDGMGFVAISEVKPRPLSGTYEEALDRVQETGWPAYASILPESVDSNSVSTWTRTEDSVGAAVVITNDGWILSHTSSLPSTSLQGYEIWIAGERYEIEKVVHDDLTDFVLIQVDAQGLPSIAFGASEDMQGGEIIFHIPAYQEIASSSIESVHFADTGFVQPAEVFVNSWKTSCSSSSGPVLNSNGELVGFIEDTEIAIPVHNAVPFVQSVLRSGDSTHAAIGAYVTDVSSVLNISDDLVGDIRAGAMIYSNVRGIAVLRNSPAAKAELQAGDIIILVDGKSVSDKTTLAEIIAKYSVGDSANFRYVRDGEEKDVDIEFVDYSELNY